jgi:hypothetical protein
METPCIKATKLVWILLDEVQKVKEKRPAVIDGGLKIDPPLMNRP